MVECLSRFVLVRFASDDLPAAEKHRVRGHLQDCDACSEILDQIRTRFDEFKPEQASHLASVLSHLDTEGVDQRARSTPWRMAPVFGLAATILLGLAVWRLMGPRDVGDRYKGDLAVKVIAKRDNAQFIVKDGQVLKADDTLRFVLTTSTAGFLSIFSYDSRGVVSQFYPEGNPEDDPTPLAIDAPGVHELPGAILLDDAPGQEIVIAVFSSATFNRNKVQTAAIPLAQDGGDTLLKKNLAENGLLVQIWRFSKPPQ